MYTLKAIGFKVLLRANGVIVCPLPLLLRQLKELKKLLILRICRHLCGSLLVFLFVSYKVDRHKLHGQHFPLLGFIPNTPENDHSDRNSMHAKSVL